MHKKKRNIFSILLAVTLFAGAVFSVHATTVQEAEQSMQEAEKEAAEAERQAEEAKKRAEELQQKENAVKGEQESLSAELSRIVEEVKAAQEKLDEKELEIEETEQELIQARVNENTQYESMKKRIKYIYENGNQQLITMILESNSIEDLLNRAEYVSQISAYDREMLVEFQEIVKEVEEKEKQLQEEYEELKVLQDELIEKQNEVDKLLQEKNVQLADLQSEIGENAAALEALKEQVEHAKAKQQQAEEAKQAALEAEREANNNQNMGEDVYRPGNSDVVVSGNGQFTNPCPGGVVTSTFGYRTFDNSFHNGLDLGAAEGTPTYAAGEGRVLIAGWSNSAGNWIVIDHGNGFVGKYMHHSALAVRQGDYVQKGQQIGYVGNTGNSFGAHLHFQLELNGTPVDPQKYL